MAIGSDSFSKDSFDPESFDFLGAVTNAVAESADIPESAKDVIKAWLA